VGGFKLPKKTVPPIRPQRSTTETPKPRSVETPSRPPRSAAETPVRSKQVGDTP